MLADDIRSLCNEILAMRNMRGNLMGELQRETQGRKQAVTELCAHFGSARVSMAKRTKDERVAYLNSLNRSVGALLGETRNDLAGARRAWAGTSS